MSNDHRIEMRPQNLVDPRELKFAARHRTSADAALARTVILIGPPPSMTGGISVVVGQMSGMDLSPRYQPRFMPMTFSPGGGESKVARVVRHVRQANKLRSIIRATRAFIVHIHTCSGMSFWRSLIDQRIAQSSGCRTVLHIHGARFDEFFDRAGSFAKHNISSGLTRADVVVALSSAWHQTLTHIAPHANVKVIENAVEVETTSEPRTSVRAVQGPCRFLLLARMDVWKGIDDLLQACKLLRSRGVRFALTLAGPPGSAGDVSAKIQSAQLDDDSHSQDNSQAGPFVRYVGEVLGSEKDRWLRWADVYVQPSHNEGMPIAVLEALAYGLPIIATRVGAMSSIIASSPVDEATPPPTRGDATCDSPCGLLTPPRDPQALADAMERLATDESARKAMATAAANLARSRFSLARLRQDVIDLYYSLDTATDTSLSYLSRPRGRKAIRYSLATLQQQAQP